MLAMGNLIGVFVGFVLGLIVMYFVRAEVVKTANEAVTLAQKEAADAKQELDKVKNAGAAVVQGLHPEPPTH